MRKERKVKTCPSIKLLRSRPELVMVPIKRRKRAQHSPSRTQSLIDMPSKTTHIDPDHGYLINRRKREHTPNTESIMPPAREIITKPFANFGSCTGKRRTSNHHWSDSGTPGQHRIVALRRHHGPVQAMHVVLGQAVVVDHVRVNRLVGDAAFFGIPRV